MVFCSFIRRARQCPINMKFFQSSASYLNNQSLTKHWGHYTKKFGDGPHPSQHSESYMVIGIGHYGLYYSIYNRETDKHRSNGIDIFYFNPLVNFHIPVFANSLSSLSFDNVNQELYKNISQLKKGSSSLFSTYSLVSKRSFSTVPTSYQKNPSTINNIIPQLKDLEEKHDANVEIFSGLKTEVVDDFDASQLRKINDLFNKGNFELIYPIYQSLKRNNSKIPSVEVYNVVLKSLIHRKINSSIDLEEIEIKLTNILTVYQDILQLSNEKLKPNTETFNLVILALLDGSLKSIKYNKSSNLPVILYNDSFVKAQEFILIALELLLSIKDFQTLNLSTIYPKLFAALNQYPNLIDKKLLNLIFNNLIKDINQFDYYNELINLTQHFRKYGCLDTNEECYDFLFHIYGNYQNAAEITREFSPKLDFKLYQSIIVQLIRTDNFEVATKFLDEILILFKKHYKMEDKRSISDLISKYLIEVSNFNLNESYKLMKEFNKVNFVPELSMELNNGLIDRFIQKYYHLETLKQKDSNQISKYNEEQERIYNSVWEIVNYNLVRKDFLLNSSLFSFSIDINDYDNVFKMTKILLLSDQLVDLTMLKKLLAYYANGLQHNFGVYYDVMLNIIEHQSKFYSNHKKLNDYFSEVVDYLIVPGNKIAFQRLINSPMVNNIFNSFDLINDKIYGLIRISKYFLSHSDTNALLSDDMSKVLNYESILINEFENPEIVYVQLDDDLKSFKDQLCSHFERKHHILEFETAPMKDTLSYLGISSEPKKVRKMVTTMDLCNLFNINYHIGVYNFVKNFKTNTRFSNSTLRVLTEKEFLLNHLSKININKFVKMYLTSGDQSLVDLLLSQNIDKITIAILKNVQELPESTFNICLDNCLKSHNKYLFSLFNNVIGEAHMDTMQVTKYLKILMNHEQFDVIQEVFDRNPDLIYVNDATVTYLKYLLVTKQMDVFTKIIKQNFNDKDSMKIIMEDEELKSVINDYYFIANINVRIPTDGKAGDFNKVADLLFSQLGDIESLRSLYQMNNKLININQQLVLGSLLTKISDYKLDYRLIWNFCKVSNITKLSVSNFKKLITILYNLKDETKLNIVFQKFLNGQKLASYLQFDILEILIASGKDKRELLALFKSFFKSLNSKVNLARIDNYTKQHQICL